MKGGSQEDMLKLPLQATFHTYVSNALRKSVRSSCFFRNISGGPAGQCACARSPMQDYV